jgi:hypothetical protein
MDNNNISWWTLWVTAVTALIGGIISTMIFGFKSTWRIALWRQRVDDSIARTEGRLDKLEAFSRTVERHLLPPDEWRDVHEK